MPEFIASCYLANNPNISGDQMYRLNSSQYLYLPGTWVPENIIVDFFTNEDKTLSELNSIFRGVASKITDEKKTVDKETAQQHYLLKGIDLGLNYICGQSEEIPVDAKLPDAAMNLGALNPGWVVAGAAFLLIILGKKKK